MPPGAGITLKETPEADIPTPTANKATIYIDSVTGEPYYKDDAGVAHPLKGTVGTTGPAGPPGEQGEPGEDGEAGPQGPAGPQGATGATGPTGPAGSNAGLLPPEIMFESLDELETFGVPGTKGDKGDTGAQGPPGTGGGGAAGMLPPEILYENLDEFEAFGIPGQRGATGATGATGPQGPAGSGGSGGEPLYFPGKNATAHGDDDAFNSSSGSWTDVNWSGITVENYNSTIPGAHYIRYDSSADGSKIRAKVKAIPAGDWSKVLVLSPPVRNHSGLLCGIVLSTTNDGTTGNQSLFYCATTSGHIYCGVQGFSNWGGTNNGAQIAASGWAWGNRVLLRWDRASGVDTIYWGILDPYTGVRWGGKFTGMFYGSIAYYGPAFMTNTGMDPIELAFHDLYHFDGSFPAGGCAVLSSVGGSTAVATPAIPEIVYENLDEIEAFSVPGAQGAPGPTGATGPQGPAGPPGADGLDGEDGADGQPGPQGPQGIQGIQGPVGEQGLHGLPGPAGEPGEDGEDGFPGPQGIQGIQGPQGPQGLQGIPGIDGEDGEDGAIGPQGPAGLQGATGPQGSQGPQGLQGLPGIDGEDGEDGSPGPQGPQGAQGIQGIQGPTGPQGAQGIPGLAGVDGEDGEDGLPGPQGPQGSQGIQGPQGPQGVEGSPGSPGIDGEDGEDGAPGPMGPQGPQGIQGIQGPQGSTGPPGPATGVPMPPEVTYEEHDEAQPPFTGVNQKEEIFAIVAELGSASGAGSIAIVVMPFSGAITQSDIDGDVSGSAVVNIYKAPVGTPTTFTSIVASAKPTLSSQQSVTDSTLTGWTRNFVVGDRLKFVCESLTTIVALSNTLRCKRI